MVNEVAGACHPADNKVVMHYDEGPVEKLQ